MITSEKSFLFSGNYKYVVYYMYSFIVSSFDQIIETFNQKVLLHDNFWKLKTKYVPNLHYLIWTLKLSAATSQHTNKAQQTNCISRYTKPH